MDSKRLLVAHFGNRYIAVKEQPDRPWILGRYKPTPGYVVFSAQTGSYSVVRSSRLQPLADAVPINHGALIELTHAPQPGSVRLDMGENCHYEWEQRAGIKGVKETPRTVYIKVLKLEKAPHPLTW